MAEYEALLGALRIAIELDIKHLDIRGDSQLVIDQVMKNTSCHDAKMEAYCAEVHKLEDNFLGFEINHIACKYNEGADELAKIASGRITVPPNIFARDIAKPFVNLDKPAASSGNASGADPLRHTGIDPMDEDPTNGELEASDLEGSQADEAQAMEIDNLPPLCGTSAMSTLPGWIGGSSLRNEPMQVVFPGKPSPSSLSMACCTSAAPQG
jgi:hypothetical protein